MNYPISCNYTYLFKIHCPLLCPNIIQYTGWCPHADVWCPTSRNIHGYLQAVSRPQHIINNHLRGLSNSKFQVIWQPEVLTCLEQERLLILMTAQTHWSSVLILLSTCLTYKWMTTPVIGRRDDPLHTAEVVNLVILPANMIHPGRSDLIQDHHSKPLFHALGCCERACVCSRLF